ncbi:MAG TPA: DUF1257 domain-containing protein [Methanoregulaceae archaeon]|nr:DUF1257 domain-containing protein [Methanoregulaceae archaeon]HPD74700.1 DUF1257 domain-containing protein [Methanoregulaceae archaeon]
MSHFSRIKTQFKNRDALIDCLTGMDFIIGTDTTIRGHRGLINVDIAAKNRQGNEIGFVRNADGSYDMVGDWWAKGGVKEQDLARALQEQAGRIQQEYARCIVIEETKKEGFSVVRQVEEEDGAIRILVRRWVS